MKKLLACAAIALFCLSFYPSEAGAFYLWRYREDATDCTALTDGKVTDLCYENDADTFYKCEPTAGDCDTAAEWRKLNTTGNATTATALAANGANCGAGNSPLGVDASGAVEGCFAVLTAEVDGSTTNEIQNLFETIATSSGTSPVADSATDTLTLTGGTGITITGVAGTDTITIATTVVDTDTNANTICTGTTTYLDGEGNCDDLSLVYQPLDSDLTSWAGVTRASGFDTFTATPSSANLASLLTDETGSGAAVFGTSPTIATPVMTLEDGNGAAPTTDGRIKYDRTAERLQVGDGSGTKSFVPVTTQTDAKYCIYDSASKSIVCNSTVSGSDTNANAKYDIPLYATAPLEAADSIPPLTKDSAGTNVDQLTVSFDASADECRTTFIQMPSDLASGTVTFDLWWYSLTATTGSVTWYIKTHGGTVEGGNVDASLTNYAAASDAVQGTVRLSTLTEWTSDITTLGWTAKDLIPIVICRDGDGSIHTDDMAGDAQGQLLHIEVPRA